MKNLNYILTIFFSLFLLSCTKEDLDVKPDWEVTSANWEIDPDWSIVSTHYRLHIKVKNNTNKTAKFVSMLAKLVKPDGTIVDKTFYTAPHPSIIASVSSANIEPNEEHDFFDLGYQGFYFITQSQYDNLKNLELRTDWTIEYE